MSYILDALRRADAERERGNVPNIHAPSVPRVAADAAAPTAGNPLVWIIIGLSVVLLGALAWITMSGPADTPAPMVVAVPAVDPTRPVAPPVPAPEPQVQAAAVMPIPPVVEPRAEAPKAATPRGAAAKGPAEAASEPARVIDLAELPDAVRRELPALTVGGAMHSQTAANRMLIVNGQLLHEGDKVSPGLTLEQIRLKSAVLAYKGQRFSINY